MNRILRAVILGILLPGILLGACQFLSAEKNAETPAPSPGDYVVDPLFWDVYILLGGIETFGQPISEVIWQDGFTCQYMMNAEFCYDPAKSGVDAYSLAPVVLNGNLLPPAVLELPPQQGEKLVNGFTILPDFVPLYEQLYGALFTGEPLGEAWVNYEKGRVEQYFANVIIAQDMESSEARPYLLPAAYAVCDQHCNAPQAVELPIPVRRSNGSPFSTLLGIANGGDFGEPLTTAFYTEDGTLMQVYEAIVIVAPPDQIENARLLPLADMLGMFRMEPIQQQFGTDREVFFYPVEQERGFHVPIVFDDFIAAHGGRLISGDPIAETAYYGEETIRQCFEFYCLDLAQSPAGQSARLTPLGAWYLRQELEAGRISPEVLLKEWHTLDSVVIGVGEQAQIISHDTPQMMIATVHDFQTGAPVRGVGGTLVLYTAGI